MRNSYKPKMLFTGGKADMDYLIRNQRSVSGIQSGIGAVGNIGSMIPGPPGMIIKSAAMVAQPLVGLVDTILNGKKKKEAINNIINRANFENDIRQERDNKRVLGNFESGGKMRKGLYKKNFMKNDGGKIIGPPHSKGGVTMVDNSGNPIAEAEGNERVFSVEDTAMMEEMAMKYADTNDETILTQLGAFVVNAINKQEQVNPSSEGISGLSNLVNQFPTTNGV